MIHKATVVNINNDVITPAIISTLNGGEASY